MYCGGNQWVEAHGSSRGFKANSIVVNNDAANEFAEYASMSKTAKKGQTYVLRYTGN